MGLASLNKEATISPEILGSREGFEPKQTAEPLDPVGDLEPCQPP